MEILLVAAVGALLVAAVKKGRGAQTQTGSPSDSGSTALAPTTQPKVDASTQLGAAGLGTAGAAAGLSLVAGGIVAAGTLGAYGGSQLGKEIDRTLGGDGTGTTGIIAQTTGGIVGAAVGTTVGAGVAIALTGATAGALFTVAILAATVAVAALVVGVLVYVVAVIWTDVERLQKGQTGALAEYWSKWSAMYSTVKSYLQNLGSLSPDEANLFAIAFTDEFMQEANKQAFRAWMNKPRGLGQSDLSHALYGRDRAYYVGSATRNVMGAVQQTNFPEMRGNSVDTIKNAPGDFKAVMYSLGKKGATLAAYLKGMTEGRGLGQTEESHFEYWRKELGFLGSSAGNGRLSYEGKTYLWQDLKAQKALP